MHNTNGRELKSGIGGRYGVSSKSAIDVEGVKMNFSTGIEVYCWGSTEPFSSKGSFGAKWKVE